MITGKHKDRETHKHRYRDKQAETEGEESRQKNWKTYIYTDRTADEGETAGPAFDLGFKNAINFLKLKP